MVGRQSDATSSAFSQLIEAIQKDIASARHAGEAARAAGSHQIAGLFFSRATKLDRILVNVRAAQRQWRDIREADREGGRRGQRRRLGERLQPGIRTPKSAFEVPILQVLAELGGAGRVQDVLDRVEQLMAPRLKNVDRQPLPSTPTTERWRNTAQWARMNLIKRGLLDGASPRGTWRLTELGRQYLAEARRPATDGPPK